MPEASHQDPAGTRKVSGLSLAALRRFAAGKRTATLVSVNVATNIIRIASNLVLTRLLAPEAFGAVGVMMALLQIFVMLTDMGFNAFVIRHRDGDQSRFLDMVWTVRLARNALLTALMLAGSGPLASAFGKPELQAGVAAMSFILLIEGLKSMSFISAERQRRVSFVSAVELGIFLIQTLAVLLLAYLLESYWALILAQFVGAILSVVASYALFAHSAQRLAFDGRVFRDLWEFGKFVWPTSAITLFVTQADKALIGRSLPLDQFGLYMLAANLTAAARMLIVSWCGRVLYPYFSEAGRISPEAAAAAYYPSRRKLSLLLALCLGAAVGGGDLIARALFDPRYLESGVYISLLALAPLLSLTTLPAEMAIVATGRVRAGLEANLLRLAWIVVAAPLGLAYGGLLGLVAAFALIEAPAIPYWFWRLAQAKILNIKEEGLVAVAAAVGAASGFGAARAAKYAVAAGLLPDF